MCSMSVVCPLCAQTSFHSVDALRINLIRAANAPLACPLCQDVFLGLDKLTIHLFSHTGDNVPMMPAGKVTMEQPLNVDKVVENSFSKTPKLRTKTTAPYKNENETDKQESVNIADTQPLITCDICEFNFHNTELRDLHYRLVHQNFGLQQEQCASTSSSSSMPDSLFKCHLCVKTFKMKGSLRVHLKVVHSVGVNQTNSNMGICERIRCKKATFEAKSPQHNTAQSLLSPTVQSSLSMEPSLNAVAMGAMTIYNQNENKLMDINPILMNSTENNCSTSTVSVVVDAKSSLTPLNQIRPSESELRPVVDNPKVWECDVCSKSFTTKYFLKKHKRLHTGEMPYTCKICSRTFTFQQSYHKHLLYHSDEKPHICSTCGRSFKELSTLHNHERIHSGEKPFKCEVCGKCFRQRVSFLVHTRIHTGVMPYKCDRCLKSFRYKVSQRTHKCLPAIATSPKDDIDHIADNFIKDILGGVTSTDTDMSIIASTENNSHNSLEDEALLSKTIDEFVAETCQKLGIGNDTNTRSYTEPSTDDIFNSNTNSPNSASQRLANMHLYSPESPQKMIEYAETTFPSYIMMDDGLSTKM